MLRYLRAGAAGFEELPPAACVDPGGWSMPADVVWLDLLTPSRPEELCVEKALGVLLPTREEMLEIEPSSRLYQDNGATFLTALVLYNSDSGLPSAGPVTFVLVGQRLVTIRYMEPKSFALFAAQAKRQPGLCPNGMQTFLGLVDAIVDRTADILENVGAEVEAVSEEVFLSDPSRRFTDILQRLGRAQNAAAKIRDSLVSLGRLASFASLADQIEREAEFRDHLRTISRDVTSLRDQAGFLSGNISFLLDTALGLINIEQNAIIKIFSVAAVAFLPPTLIASIYGMNFHHMPELERTWGYPAVLGLMAAVEGSVLLYFWRRGWLGKPPP